MAESRSAEAHRKTGETDIRIRIDLDGEGAAEVDTGLPFVDHMLHLFARHGLFDLRVQAKGDLEVDAHRTVEDLGIVLGDTFRQGLGSKAGIRRYGFFLLTMDDTLVRVALDLSGRPYLIYELPTPTPYINGIDTRLFHEFWRAFTNSLALNLHIDLLRGEETHHVLEASFKGVARALDMATQVDPRHSGVPSTKGSL